MKQIKFDACREILTSGNVWNCVKKPIVMQSVQMLEDFELETLEHQDAPYKGKAGDYIMISPSCEMYVCDKDYFEKNYDVSNGFKISQYATNAEDAHFEIGHWNDSPFNDDAMKILRLKKVQKSPSYIKSKGENSIGR